MSYKYDLSQAAKFIFDGALRRVNAEEAVRSALRIVGTDLVVDDGAAIVDLSRTIYVVAIGKAAYQMAFGLQSVAGEYVKTGVITGIKPALSGWGGTLWQEFNGGHPLPNQESVAAAKACIQMLQKANAERAPVIFLISGGGSAMMELPRDPEIDLDEIRKLNHLLVTSGASIAEINSVRRSVSVVKGGGLAAMAPNSHQVSLIISDTQQDDVTTVASGPSLPPELNLPNAADVVERYKIVDKIPEAILTLINDRQLIPDQKATNNSFHVLLDNRTIVDRAAEISRDLGFVTETDQPKHDDLIEDGVETFLRRSLSLRESTGNGKSVCFISGGEFGCEVKGKGLGGRNSETVLRLGLLAEDLAVPYEFAFLSVGSDGIDGNSPAAGGIVDRELLSKARSHGADPLSFLQNSDSYTFLDRFDAAIVTGPTGTNVRDIRLVLVR